VAGVTGLRRAQRGELEWRVRECLRVVGRVAERLDRGVQESP